MHRERTALIRKPKVTVDLTTRSDFAGRCLLCGGGESKWPRSHVVPIRLVESEERIVVGALCRACEKATARDEQSFLSMPIIKLHLNDLGILGLRRRKDQIKRGSAVSIHFHDGLPGSLRFENYPACEESGYKTVRVRKGRDFIPLCIDDRVGLNGWISGDATLERFLAKLAFTNMAFYGLLSSCRNPRYGDLRAEVMTDIPRLSSLSWVEQDHNLNIGSSYSKVSHCLIPPRSHQPFAFFSHLGEFRWIKALVPSESETSMARLMEAARLILEGGGSEVVDVIGHFPSG